MVFTWIPFYKEFAQKLLKFRNNRKPLIDWIYNNLEGNIKHLKDAPDGRRVADIDPLSVFSIINRSIAYEKKKNICAKFKKFLDISSSVPEDFHGVPEMNAMQTNFMAFEKDREEGDIERLWNVFEDAVLDKSIEKSYNALSNQYLIKYNLTMGLFWIRPDKYLALDGNNRDKLKKLGIASFNGKFVPYNEYEGIMKRLDEKMLSGEIDSKNYAEFSYSAYTQNDEPITHDTVKDQNSTYIKKDKSYWIYSPGENASKWSNCIEEGIMCIGWDELGDLSKYRSREEMRYEVKKQRSIGCSAVNDSLAVWQFSREMKPGDVVFAKKGMYKIVGCGVVESDYIFDESRTEYKHIRKVRWTHIGEWNTTGKNVMKTLTNITAYADYVETLIRLVESKDSADLEESTDQQYWWLTGNPDYWSPTTNWDLGEDIDYTLYNEKGNKRRIFKHFMEAKSGDVVIAYEASPVLKIVAIGRVVSETDGEVLYIRKIEELLSPVPYSEILTNPILKNSEPVQNRCQGSLFHLSNKEYEEVMSLIRRDNPEPIIEVDEQPEVYSPYTDKDFLEQVYIDEHQLQTLKSLLARKKNLILQGAPGVEKPTQQSDWPMLLWA